MSENTDETTNESILYEILEYFVRKQEPELTVSYLIFFFHEFQML